MNKLLKKLSISQIIIYLSLLAIIFSSVIGIFGYFDMKQLNDTTKDMNANVTLPMSYIGSLRSDSLNVQLCVAKSNANYDTKYQTTISELDVKIQKSLKSYLSTDLDPEEKVGLNNFSKDYTDYLTLWNKVSPELARNGKLSPEDIKTFDSLGDDMGSNLKGLNDYNIKWAGIWTSDNNALFKSSTERYIMLDSIIILVFMLITFVVIKFIKRSSKETIDYLDVISQGDFTKKVTDGSKNEFATIENSIAKTVHNISLLIESIKDKSINIEQDSKELSSLSEEMTVSSDNVVMAINQTAAGADSQANDLLDITNVLEKFSLELETMVKAIEDIDSNAKGINSMANENHEDLQSLVKSVGRIND